MPTKNYERERLEHALRETNITQIVFALTKLLFERCKERESTSYFHEIEQMIGWLAGMSYIPNPWLLNRIRDAFYDMLIDWEHEELMTADTAIEMMWEKDSCHDEITRTSKDFTRKQQESFGPPPFGNSQNDILADLRLDHDAE